MSPGYGDSPSQDYLPLSPPAGSTHSQAHHGYNPAHSSLDILPAYDAPPSLPSKGKNRARSSFDDSTDDGMAWEGNASMTDRLARRSTDQDTNRRPSNVGTFGGPGRGAGRQGWEREDVDDDDGLEDELGEVEGLGVEGSEVERRRRSALWWRAAMINILFIIAW